MRRIKESTYFEEIYVNLRPKVDKMISRHDALIAGYELGSVVNNLTSYVSNIYSEEEGLQFKEALRDSLIGVL